MKTFLPLTVAALALALTACADASTSATDRPDGTPTASPSALRTETAALPYDAVSAPAAFSGREPLPSCGTYVLSPIDGLPAHADRCLRGAVGSPDGAELGFSSVTVEGDPVVTYVRALPGTSTLEYFADSTQDAFGSGTWTRATCTGLAPARDQLDRATPTGCTEPIEYLNGDLVGTWIPRDISGTDLPRSADRRRYAITFERDGTWGGSDGCNELGGTYSVSADGTFTATSGPHTEIGCENVPHIQVLTGASHLSLNPQRLRFLAAQDDPVAGPRILGDYTRVLVD